MMRRQANFFKARMVPESVIAVNFVKSSESKTFELTLNDTKEPL